MTIKQNKRQTLLYGIITLVVFVGFLCFTIFDMRKLPHDHHFVLDNAVVYYIFKALCFVCVIMTGVAAVWFFKQLSSQEPLIEICGDYFYDRSSTIALGKIAWSDMERAYIKDGVLNVQLKNPDKYFQKKNWIQKALIKANLRMGLGHVCISSQRFKKEGELFLHKFSEKMKIDP